jgi:hypothetical protein
MATFTFTGDPRAPGTDPLTCEMGGVVFTFLVPTPVEDKALAEKLRRHSHFTEVEDEVEAPKGYRAVHKGRGKYAIVFGDKDAQVTADLSKADAEAFNDLSDADKLAYLDKAE